MIANLDSLLIIKGIAMTAHWQKNQLMVDANVEMGLFHLETIAFKNAS